MSSPPQMVSNAGPLMVLAKLHLLHLLDLLYGRVRIARSVYEEAVVEGLRYGHSKRLTPSHQEHKDKTFVPSCLCVRIQARVPAPVEV